MKEKDNPQKANLGAGNTALLPSRQAHTKKTEQPRQEAGYPRKPMARRPWGRSPCVQERCGGAGICIAPRCASPLAGTQEPAFTQTWPDVALGDSGAKGVLAGRVMAKRRVEVGPTTR